MFSISCWFLCFHTILLCFLCIMGFYFDVWNVSIGDFCIFLWNLSLLTLILCLISNLFYGFCLEILYEILAIMSWFLFEPIWNSFWPTPTSKLIDWNMKRGLYGFIFVPTLGALFCYLPLFLVLAHGVQPTSHLCLREWGTANNVFSVYGYERLQHAR